jgi:hypothetical protein
MTSPLGVAGAAYGAIWRLVAKQAAQWAAFDRELYYKISARYMFHSYKKFILYQIRFARGLASHITSC